MSPSRRALLPALALLAGCATEAAFDQRMTGLVGLSEPDLVRTIGVPDAAYEADRRRFLQYDRLGRAGAATVQPSFGVGVGGFSFSRGVGIGTGFGFGGPAFVNPPPTCSVTFEMVAGRVASYTRRGDSCVATPP
ncbi:MAG TPA: hypothetical protein VD970_11355 [Acetobacteraceae bacterium]|nr:hypothetical protein [Acetobacteraceae bacterium]